MAESTRGRQGWQQLAWWHGDGIMDLGATVGWLPSDELTAVDLLAEIWPGYLHYAADPKRWHIWTGTHHPPDDSLMIDRTLQTFARWYAELIAEARRQVLAQVTASMPDAEAKDIDKAAAARWLMWEPKATYAKKLRSTAGLAALRTAAAGRFGVPENSLADQHPFELNLLSGTLHLPSLTEKPHDPADLITYCLNARWSPMGSWAEGCPNFWRLLFRAAGEDMDIATYLVKALGYALIGDNPEQLIFFLQGDTASGKSTLLDIVVSILGPLGHHSTVDLICVTKNGRNARTENSIRGKRLIAITETSGWLVIEEAQLKRLTGERYIAVDRHYAPEQIRTYRTWVIFIATNELPSIGNPDSAVQRRAVVVPMGAMVPEHLRDKQMAERIIAQEASGVVSLLAWGCAEVLAGRFGQPERVRRATQEYWDSQNTITQFLRDCTTFEQVRASDNGAASRSRAAQHQTWQAYQWHTRSGPRLPKQEFKSQLCRVAGVHAVESTRVYEGFELTPYAMEQIT